jgi:hypothetical protein
MPLMRCGERERRDVTMTDPHAIANAAELVLNTSAQRIVG